MSDESDVFDKIMKAYPLPKFKMGQVVWLNSGSPALTVMFDTVRGAERTVDVEWFDGGEVRRDAFPEVSLSASKPE